MISEQRVETVANELLGLFRAGRPTAPYSSRFAGFDARDAYAVAVRLRALRAARGERAVGRKIGFTNATVQAIYGVREPIWNFMFDSTVRDLGATGGRLDLEGLVEPRLEPEIAFRFGSAPRPDMSDDELLGSIDGIAHGFEIVQSIFPGWRFTAPDAVAAYGLHGAYGLGERRPVAGRPREWAEALRTFTIELRCDDGRVLTGGGANVLGSPLAALRHCLAVLETFPPEERVQAGEIVTTGTLTDAPAVAPGQTWSTTIDGLALEGLSLRLE